MGDAARVAKYVEERLMIITRHMQLHTEAFQDYSTVRLSAVNSAKPSDH